MELKETVELMNRIKSFRPRMYDTLNEYEMDHMQIEWQKVLEPYDYDDVNKALTHFFETDTKHTFPGVYMLIRNLRTVKDKESSKEIKTNCQLCQKEINLSDYTKHYRRCSSCEYLIRMCRKHLNKQLNYNKLFELPDDEFDKLYEKICQDLYNNMENSREKENLGSYLRGDYEKIRTSTHS